MTHLAEREFATSDPDRIDIRADYLDDGYTECNNHGLKQL